MVRLRLREFLESRGITVYRLEKECRDVSRTTLYALTGGKAQGVQFATLGAVVATLRRLTGEPVSVCDLLEYDARGGEA